MAVPFIPEEEVGNDHLQVHTMVTLLQWCIGVLEEMLRHLQQHPAATQSRLPRCEDDNEEDADDDHPPSVAPPALASEATAAVDGGLPLPDVVPRPAPRAPVRWPAQSAFTKYLTAEGNATTRTPSAPEYRQPVAESDTTLCYMLPDLVAGLEPRPSHALGSFPAPALPARPVWPASPETGAQENHPAPPLEDPKACCPARPARPAPEWLLRQEDELEKTLSKMAACGLCSPERQQHQQRGDWVRIGENLRCLADGFSLPAADEVDSKQPSPGLLAMLLPTPVKGTFLTTVILWVGWRLLSRSR